MTERENYTLLSLELHLFFLRIMKEHAHFFTASFMSTHPDLSKKSFQFKQNFESILARLVSISNGILDPELINSCELVTGCTLTAEQNAKAMTGIPINTKLTQVEERFSSKNDFEIPLELSQFMKNTNQQVLPILNQFIHYQEFLLKNIRQCKLHSNLYPSLVRHFLNESMLYEHKIYILENNNCSHLIIQDEEMLFWCEAMEEHAQFLYGYLDPCEKDTQIHSQYFIESFEKAQNSNIENTLTILTEAENFRDYIQKLTLQFTQCSKLSIMLPLLSDHFLREANHYLYLLRIRYKNITHPTTLFES